MCIMQTNYSGKRRIKLKLYLYLQRFLFHASHMPFIDPIYSRISTETLALRRNIGFHADIHALQMPPPCHFFNISTWSQQGSNAYPGSRWHIHVAGSQILFSLPWLPIPTSQSSRWVGQVTPPLPATAPIPARHTRPTSLSPSPVRRPPAHRLTPKCRRVSTGTPRILIPQIRRTMPLAIFPKALMKPAHFIIASPRPTPILRLRASKRPITTTTAHHQPNIQR